MSIDTIKQELSEIAAKLAELNPLRNRLKAGEIPVAELEANHRSLAEIDGVVASLKAREEALNSDLAKVRATTERYDRACRAADAARNHSSADAAYAEIRQSADIELHKIARSAFDGRAAINLHKKAFRSILIEEGIRFNERGMILPEDQGKFRAMCEELNVMGVTNEMIAALMDRHIRVQPTRFGEVFTLNENIYARDQQKAADKARRSQLQAA